MLFAAAYDQGDRATEHSCLSLARVWSHMTQFADAIPLLIRNDILAAVRFLLGVLGCEDGAVEKGSSGEPLHGEVRAREMTKSLVGTRDLGCR